MHNQRFYCVLYCVDSMIRLLNCKRGTCFCSLSIRHYSGFGEFDHSEISLGGYHFNMIFINHGHERVYMEKKLNDEKYDK